MSSAARMKCGVGLDIGSVDPGLHPGYAQHRHSMQIEITRLTAGDAALLDRVADDVFDAPLDPRRLAAYLAEPQLALPVPWTTKFTAS